MKASRQNLQAGEREILASRPTGKIRKQACMNHLP
jgi:hypothetical protein